MRSSPTLNLEPLAAAVALHLVRSGTSAATFASQAGISPSVIESMIKGSSSDLSLLDAIRIASRAGISIDALFDLNTEVAPPPFQQPLPSFHNLSGSFIQEAGLAHLPVLPDATSSQQELQIDVLRQAVMNAMPEAKRTAWNSVASPFEPQQYTVGSQVVEGWLSHTGLYINREAVEPQIKELDLINVESVRLAWTWVDQNLYLLDLGPRKRWLEYGQYIAEAHQNGKWDQQMKADLEAQLLQSVSWFRDAIAQMPAVAG